MMETDNDNATSASMKKQALNPPRLRYEIGSVVVPGDRIGPTRQVKPGHGTYSRAGHVYACLVGRLHLTTKTAVTSEDATSNEEAKTVDVNTDSTTTTFFVCSVVPNGSKTIPQEKPYDASSHVLKIGQRVIGKVIRLSPQNVVLELKVAEDVGPLSASLEGAIRMEDIRSGATDQIVVSDWFRVGDLVLVRVVSMGDSRRYFLSTAEPELGVIRALSETSGKPMMATSWKEMKCPETGVTESRKCAKPPSSLAAGEVQES